VRWVLVLSFAGCGRIGFVPVDNGSDAGVTPDAAAILAQPFGTPTLLSILSTPGTDDDPSLTNDLLEIYYESSTPGITASQRPTGGSPWGPPATVPVLDVATCGENQFNVSGDGLSLFFACTDAGGTSTLYSASRPDRSASWSVPQPISELANGDLDQDPYPSRDGSWIYFYSNRGLTAGTSVWVAKRPAPGAPFAAPENVPSLGDAQALWVSEDELVTYFESSRTGNRDIYFATRASRADPFGPAQPLAEINTLLFEEDPWLSTDLRLMIFSKETVPGDRDLYIATR